MFRTLHFANKKEGGETTALLASEFSKYVYFANLSV